MSCSPPESLGDTATRTYLAFDFGLRAIGVATAQALTGTSTPLGIVNAKAGVPDWEQIASLLEEWRPDALIVGLPLNMDGSESDMSARARKFAARLEGRFSLPVHMADERLSSREATARSGNRRDHALAAKIIAEGFLSGDCHPWQSP